MRIDLGNDCDFEATADRGVAVPAIDIRTGPFSRIALGRQALWSLSVTMITAASLAASIAALGLGLWIADRQDFDMGLTAPLRSQLIVPFALLPLLQALVGLIPGYGIGPVQRLRRHIHATLLLGAAVAVCFLSSQPEPRLLSAGMAGLAIQAFLTPFVDHLCRRMLSGTRCWGASALVVGAGPAGERVVKLLRADPRFGYRPLGLLDDDASLHGTEVAGVPVLGPTGLMWDADLARQVGLLIVTIPLKAVAIQPVPMQVTPIKGVESADQAC